MDPLQVITAVAGLTGTCLKTAMTLDGLREKFPGAGPTISKIARECGSISASLSDVQSAVLQSLGQEGQSELYPTFDTVVVGCMVVFACLEQDIERATSSTPKPKSNSRTPWRMRETQLDEKQLEIYLAKIQDEEVAMKVLAKLLQMKAACDIKTDILKNAALFERIHSSSESLRAANRSIAVRDSLFNTPTANDSVDRGVLTTNLRSEAASPSLGPARLSPLESMWSLDSALPPSSEVRSSSASRRTALKEDAAFHTVRGLSPRDQGRASKRPSRSSSRRAEKESFPIPETSSISSISSQPSVPIAISPKLIRFSTPCEHEQAKSLPFTNTNPFPVTYKVSTTRPTSYAVRPNFGTLLPDQTVDVHFILMEILTGTEEELKRRDKFRIQSVPVEDVAHGNIFDWKARDSGAKIEESKIKVELVMSEEPAIVGTDV